MPSHQRDFLTKIVGKRNSRNVPNQFLLSINTALFYYLVLREVKYFQLAKKTVYQITDEALCINYSFLGFKKILDIKFDDINHLHLVEYEYGDIKKGSIWIYNESDIKAYDIVKKERSNLPRIQMVQNYKEGLGVLRSLVKEAKKKDQHSDC